MSIQTQRTPISTTQTYRCSLFVSNNFGADWIIRTNDVTTVRMCSVPCSALFSHSANQLGTINRAIDLHNVMKQLSLIPVAINYWEKKPFKNNTRFFNLKEAAQQKKMNEFKPVVDMLFFLQLFHHEIFLTKCKRGKNKVKRNEWRFQNKNNRQNIEKSDICFPWLLRIGKAISTETCLIRHYASVVWFFFSGKKRTN